LSETATVAIVGGGVVGASIAYHLAARGVRDVVVLERAAQPGAGSTARATGGFRVQFAAATEIRLSLLARDRLRAFHDETGGDCGYVSAGYLWLAQDDVQLEALRAALMVQRANGVDDAREVDTDASAALNPYLRYDDIRGGTFCPSDGFIRPLQILDGYRRAAERLGVRFVWDAEVIALDRALDGSIATVRTTRSAFSTGAVVNAAGAWAAPVAALAGVDLPVSPLCRQVAITMPTEALPAEMPMTLYAGDGFHLRVREGRVLLLLPTPNATDDPFEIRLEPAWIEEVTQVARARVPCLASVEIDRGACWAGLYEMSPDGRAILGASTAVPNFYFANGSSGHGVMHAPALGQLLAEIIVDGSARSLDVGPLHPDRFARGTAGRNADLL
jgi:sarcosine oxidase, subunit beta